MQLTNKRHHATTSNNNATHAYIYICVSLRANCKPGLKTHNSMNAIQMHPSYTSSAFLCAFFNESMCSSDSRVCAWRGSTQIVNCFTVLMLLLFVCCNHSLSDWVKTYHLWLFASEVEESTGCPESNYMNECIASAMTVSLYC